MAWLQTSLLVGTAVGTPGTGVSGAVCLGLRRPCRALWKAQFLARASGHPSQRSVAPPTTPTFMHRQAPGPSIKRQHGYRPPPACCLLLCYLQPPPLPRISERKSSPMFEVTLRSICLLFLCNRRLHPCIDGEHTLPWSAYSTSSLFLTSTSYFTQNLQGHVEPVQSFEHLDLPIALLSTLYEYEHETVFFFSNDFLQSYLVRSAISFP